MSAQNILVVDDEEVIRDICTQILNAEGYTVSCASSGREALGLFKDNHYDAVVTDIMMPDMSGLELLEAMRNTNAVPRSVVITGLGTFEMATLSDRLGAREFVVKPFTPDELVGAVRKALSSDASTC